MFTCQLGYMRYHWKPYNNCTVFVIEQLSTGNMMFYMSDRGGVPLYQNMLKTC